MFRRHAAGPDSEESCGNQTEAPLALVIPYCQQRALSYLGVTLYRCMLKEERVEKCVKQQHIKINLCSLFSQAKP